MGTLKPHSNGPIIQQYGDWYTGRGCYIWYSKNGPGRAAAPPSPLLAVSNVTAHPSTANVPTSYYSMCLDSKLNLNFFRRFYPPKSRLKAS